VADIVVLNKNIPPFSYLRLKAVMRFRIQISGLENGSRSGGKNMGMIRIWICILKPKEH
jgi:hypothetical protein